ncbi:MAG: hypothetical protein V4682_00665 [Patescibacteria group bacterium]
MHIPAGTRVKITPNPLMALMYAIRLRTLKKDAYEGRVLNSEIGEMSGKRLYTIQLENGGFGYHFENEIHALPTSEEESPQVESVH